MAEHASSWDGLIAETVKLVQQDCDGRAGEEGPDEIAAFIEQRAAGILTNIRIVALADFKAEVAAKLRKPAKVPAKA